MFEDNQQLLLEHRISSQIKDLHSTHTAKVGCCIVYIYSSLFLLFPLPVFSCFMKVILYGLHQCFTPHCSVIYCATSQLRSQWRQVNAVWVWSEYKLRKSLYRFIDNISKKFMFLISNHICRTLFLLLCVCACFFFFSFMITICILCLIYLLPQSDKMA